MVEYGHSMCFKNRKQSLYKPTSKKKEYVWEIMIILLNQPSFTEYLLFANENITWLPISSNGRPTVGYLKTT